MNMSVITRSKIETEQQDLATRSEPLSQATKWAFGVGLWIIGFTYIKAEISQFASGSWSLQDVISVSMIFLTIILGSLWLQSGSNEIKLICYWFRPGAYQPPTDLSVVGLIIGIGVLISLLAFTSKWAHYFGLMMFFYGLVDISWSRFVGESLKELFVYSEQEWLGAVDIGSEKRKAALTALAVIRFYYFGRPQLFRRCLLVAACVPGILLAWYGHLGGSLWATVSSYIVFVTTIVFGEIVIGKWRIDRDRKLRVLAQCFRAGKPVYEDQSKR